MNVESSPCTRNAVHIEGRPSPERRIQATPGSLNVVILAEGGDPRTDDPFDTVSLQVDRGWQIVGRGFIRAAQPKCTSTIIGNADTFGCDP